MRTSSTIRPLLVALAFAGCSSAAAPTPEAPAPSGTATESAPAEEREAAAPSTPAEGVVPEAQAERGRDVFMASCTACHASSEFSATPFRRRWQTRNAADLYRLVSSTMPEDAPNSLPPDNYVAIVAYILSMNGFEASGSAASWNVAALSDVSLSPLGGD